MGTQVFLEESPRELNTTQRSMSAVHGPEFRWQFFALGTLQGFVSGETTHCEPLNTFSERNVWYFPAAF